MPTAAEAHALGILLAGLLTVEEEEKREAGPVHSGVFRLASLGRGAPVADASEFADRADGEPVSL